MESLRKLYEQCEYKLIGNGPRQIKILQEALQDMDPETPADIYGNGKIIEDFEKEMAELLGKEAAIFFPSGTMAQQIALRVWCDQTKNYNVAYHPLCHLEIHEEDGLKELHPIKTHLLGEADRLYTLTDIIDLHRPLGALLTELPQREIGGQAPSWEKLVAISQYLQDSKIPHHLDGARLFEVCPFYQKKPAEIAALFDSVYLSFYKGLGGIAGAILAGSHDFIDKARPWKRRYGGDLISLYPYILSAKKAYEERAHKMDAYYRKAQELARRFNELPFAKTMPIVPQSNMFHVHFYLSEEELVEKFSRTMIDVSVGFTTGLRKVSDGHFMYELSIGDLALKVPADQLKVAFEGLQKNAKEASST